MRLLLCILVALVACGGSEPEPESDFTGIHGTWRASFPNADGKFELHLDGEQIRGVLGIEEYVWAVTGETVTEREFYLVLLPSRNEEPLFAALGFTLSTAAAMKPAHAADRIEFRAKAADFTTAIGVAQSRFGATADFRLAR